MVNVEKLKAILKEKNDTFLRILGYIFTHTGIKRS